jgi:hypothetical protein
VGLDVNAATEAIYVDNISVSAVPEPSTLCLAGIGLMGCAVYGFCRRRKQGEQ